MIPSSRICYCLLFSLACCGQAINSQHRDETGGENKSLIVDTGMSVRTRFNVPDGFERKPAGEPSFTEYLRTLPLKPAGTKVQYYDGSIKSNDVYDAVLDMEIGKKDLQQCADAVMRLRAEHLYSQKEFDRISFTLTNGFRVDYSEWTKGNRLVVNGNNTSWKKSAEPANDHKTFRNYMDMVFNYAGTLSLSKELRAKAIEEIASGDVFIVGGSPGHAVIVIDVAENSAGEKVFLLAQSYMPAQDIQVLKNPMDDDLSPWYSASASGKLQTPEWTFDVSDLKTW